MLSTIPCQLGSSSPIQSIFITRYLTRGHHQRWSKNVSQLSLSATCHITNISPFAFGQFRPKKFYFYEFLHLFIYVWNTSVGMSPATICIQSHLLHGTDRVNLNLQLMSFIPRLIRIFLRHSLIQTSQTTHSISCPHFPLPTVSLRSPSINHFSTVPFIRFDLGSTLFSPA